MTDLPRLDELNAKPGDIVIKKFSIGPYDNQVYILIDPETKDSVIIDAPFDLRPIVDNAKGTNPQYILLTHGHPDHWGALDELRQELKIPAAIHLADLYRLPKGTEFEFFLEDGQVIKWGRKALDVLHTPGHTEGSCSFLHGRHLISGDALFPGGPGATQGLRAWQEAVHSVRTKMFVLPDDTIVYPGHGANTRIGEEKPKKNIYEAPERPAEIS